MSISDWSSDVCSSDLGAAESERDRIKGLYDGIGLGASQAQGKVNELTGQIDTAKKLTLRAPAQVRSEERRVGKEWVRPCRSWWSSNHKHKNRLHKTSDTRI